MKPVYLAAVQSGAHRLYLSIAGTWIVRSAFEARNSPQKLRTFVHAESAKGVAEEWAARTGYEACVEEVR